MKWKYKRVSVIAFVSQELIDRRAYPACLNQAFREKMSIRLFSGLHLADWLSRKDMGRIQKTVLRMIASGERAYARWERKASNDA